MFYTNFSRYCEVINKSPYTVAADIGVKSTATIAGWKAGAVPRPADVDTEAYKKKVVEVLSVIKSPDVSAEAKNIALRSIIDKIVYDKAASTFDIYFAP